MTLTGILKNILLVIASVMIWNTKITFLQILGYTVALVGLVYYSIGWDQIKTILSAAAAQVKSIFSATPSEEGRLSTAVRRGLLVAVSLFVVSFTVIHFLNSTSGGAI